MLNLEKKNQCSGCTACVQSCPVGCINMEYDCEGFLYPKINQEKCIDCHICEKVCPTINVSNAFDSMDVYACQIMDERIRAKSTSGGAFTLLATAIIQKGGYVFAAGFDEYMHVIHKCVSRVEDLGEFRGSKYVQSELGTVFSQIKKILETTYSDVLFIGTPCQAEGLINFIGEDYRERVYVIDLLCYGVPSPGLYDKWLDSIRKRYGENIREIYFRDKKYGYAGVNVKMVLESGRILEDRWEVKTYPKSMFSNMALRPICYECPFSGRGKRTDFTVGDLWNVSKYSKEMDDNMGTTQLMVHSFKGAALLERCRREARLIKMFSLSTDALVDYWKISRITKKVPIDRTDFFDNYAKINYEELINKFLPLSFKERFALMGKPVIYRLHLEGVFFRLLKKWRQQNESNRKTRDKGTG